MNSVDFCFWLQGYFELSGATALTNKQVEIIKNHLNLVFVHEIDPMREQQTSTPVEILNETHNPTETLKIPMHPLVLKEKLFPTPFNDGHDNDVLYRC
jgi:hypothetical protein